MRFEARGKRGHPGAAGEAARPRSRLGLAGPRPGPGRALPDAILSASPRSASGLRGRSAQRAAAAELRLERASKYRARTH